MIHNDRHVIAYNQSTFYIDHNLFELNPSEEKYLNCLLAFFLSSVGILFKEFGGRVNLGEGALKTEGIDIERFLIINPNLCSNIQLEKLGKLGLAANRIEIHSVFEEIGSFDSNKVCLEGVVDNRRELDKVVMGDILGLTEEEQLEVYRAVVDLVKTRLERAKSLKKVNKTKEGIDIDSLTQDILGHMGEYNLITFYKSKIAKASCYGIDLPERAEPIEIENSLFGWRLKIGRKVIDCPSEVHARYLRVFAEMGWDKATIPKDSDYLATIINQWENLFQAVKATLEEYTSSILQNKTRDLLTHTVWAKLREQMIE